MSKRRFDRRVAGLAGVAGLSLAILLGGCVQVAQPGALADAAASGVSAVAATPAAPASDAAVVAQAASPPDAAVEPAAPATYKVRRGDTLKRIARNHSCTVKQLLAWNRLKPSAHVKPGQTLIVSSPDAARSAVASAASAPVLAAVSSSALPDGDAASAPLTPEEAREVSSGLSRHANGVSLAWPAQGNVVESFEAGETRGIEIAGKPGDPVRAAADGKVMYAGTGLNEYGSLIIVQHNKDFLTAYSHNRKLLVKSGDMVRKGQQIAEMGSENNSRVSVG
ncbi:MAG TPA: peptidoglycan DD-metalloendopeptidase family protein, partial [Paraburkholderia sp.]